MKTRAAVHVEHGQPMVVEEIELFDPGPREVIVKQFASGVCHTQLAQLQNPGQFRPALLGHESTGVVAAAGKEVSHVKEGDKVIVTWVPRAASDGMAPAPVSQFKFRGETIEARGMGARVGTVFTWAEATVADERYIVKMDDDLPTDVTSIIGCAVMTGSGAALHAAGVRPNDAVAVFGVGGVGLCIVQACANVGANPVIVVDLADEKLDFAKKFGATVGINASKEDPIARIKELTQGGVDFAFDAIGAKATMEQILQAVRPGIMGLRDGGTAVLVGLAHGAPPVLDMRDMLVASKRYIATLGGRSRPDRDFPMYMRWYKEGRLPLDLLITRRYKLDQINEACDALDRGEITGRAILEF